MSGLRRFQVSAIYSLCKGVGGGGLFSCHTAVVWGWKLILGVGREVELVHSSYKGAGRVVGINSVHVLVLPAELGDLVLINPEVSVLPFTNMALLLLAFVYFADNGQNRGSA